MIDGDIKMLLSFFPPETVADMARKLKGVRIYFPATRTEHHDMRQMYEAMIQSGCDRSDALKRVAEAFGKSESWARKVVQKQGGLFDED